MSKICPVLSKVVDRVSAGGFGPVNELYEVECLGERCVAYSKNREFTEYIGIATRTYYSNVCDYIGCEISDS